MMLPEKTDSLIAHVAMADRQAFQSLYEQTSGALFGVCCRILDDQSLAEACLEELYSEIWENADMFRGPELSPLARLTTEARRLAILQKRTQTVEPKLLRTRDLYPAASNLSDTATAGLSASASLADCLSELQPARAILLRSVCLDGEGYSDLAKASEVDEATVRRSLQKALSVVGIKLAPDNDVSIPAAEYALGLLPVDEESAFETHLAENTELFADVVFWQSHISTYVLEGTKEIAPPPQMLRRLNSQLFHEDRETLWQQFWPYAVGGLGAALLLWLAVSYNILTPLN